MSESTDAATTEALTTPSTRANALLSGAIAGEHHCDKFNVVHLTARLDCVSSSTQDSFAMLSFIQWIPFAPDS
jgi:hypothetical protein